MKNEQKIHLCVASQREHWRKLLIFATFSPPSSSSFTLFLCSSPSNLKVEWGAEKLFCLQTPSQREPEVEIVLFIVQWNDKFIVAIHCHPPSTKRKTRKIDEKFDVREEKKGRKNFIESEQNFQSTKALTSLWLCEKFSFSFFYLFLYSWWQFSSYFSFPHSLSFGPFFSFPSRSQQAEEKFQFSPWFLSLQFRFLLSLFMVSVSLFLNSIKTICDNLLDEGLSSFSECQFGLLVGRV